MKKLYFILFILLLFSTVYGQQRVGGLSQGNSYNITRDVAAPAVSGCQSDILIDLPKTRLQNPNAVAVVIGNKNYEFFGDVDYAHNDARAMKKYLIEVLGFDESRVFYIEDAKLRDFNTHFGNIMTHRGKLFRYVKSGVSDVFVFYSGHGVAGLNDEKVYLLPTDVAPKEAELSGYPLWQFYKNLNQISARSITVVMDACNSGEPLPELSGGLIIQNSSGSLKNGVVITSSSEEEYSGWYSEKCHGIFTYYFLKAIQDKNADANRDNRLTVQELYDYISDENEGVPYTASTLHFIEQHPTINGGADRDKVLVKYEN